MKVLIHVVGMSALGVVALALSGLAYEWRAQSPVPEPRWRDVVGTSSRSIEAGSLTPPFPRPLAGIYSDLSVFIDRIDIDRSAAVAALDAATRLARTLQYAAADHGEMSVLATSVEAARCALQHGDVERARGAARRALGVAAQPLALKWRRPVVLNRYAGSVALDDRGAVIGHVTGADGNSLEIESGGTPRFLGFVRLGHGTARRLNRDAAIFGAPGHGTNTFVIEVLGAMPRGAEASVGM